MKTITYSAPAKIHLMGEHSVVHGKPALLAAINKNVTASIEHTTKNEGIIFDTKNTKSLAEFRDIIDTSIKLNFPHVSIPPYLITIKSSVQIGSGLGSSAALSAVTTAALLEFLNISFDNNILFKIAYEGEKFFHGNPSGGDLAVTIEGGLLYFRKEFEFLKTFSKLDFNISNSVNNFYLIDSGKPEETTLEMVKRVGELLKKDTENVENIFNNQEHITKKLVLALKDGNNTEISESMMQGERNLEALGVVGEKAKKIISEIEKCGGSAKISGGGGINNGSGMILAYHPDKKIFQEFCKKNKHNYEEIKITEKGITKI